MNKPRLVRGLVATLLTQSLGCIVPCGDESPRVPGPRNIPYCAQREAAVKAAQYQPRM